MHTSLLVLAFLLATPPPVGIGSQGQPTQEPAAKLPPGIERMAARINKIIAGRINKVIAGNDVKDAFHLSRERVELIRMSLAQIHGDRAEMKLRMRLARELLTAGESAAAVEEL